MTDLWYYAEGNEHRGPHSLSELVSLMATKADPRRILIWRDGLSAWTPLEEVREVAKEVFRPPPLVEPAPPAVPEPPPILREPAVDEEDAAAFKDVRPHKPELTGLGGWLILVALGQIYALLRMWVETMKYYKELDPKLWTQFPVAAWGEASLNVFGVGLYICTLVLMFRKSRLFPRFFIAQYPVTILMPFVSALWIGATMGLPAGKPITAFMKFSEDEIAHLGAALIGAAIWVPYMLRSQRVRNTFTR